jgi:hypothetical protein
MKAPPDELMIEIEALVLSAAIEAPIAWFVARQTRWPCRGEFHVGAASAAATAISHPQFWSVALWSYERFAYWPSVLALEAVVVLVEGCLIAWMAGLRVDRAMIVSLLANSGSFLAGVWIDG